MTDVDYDGFDWGPVENAFRWNNQDLYRNLRSFAEAVGIEKHGIRLRKERTFERYDIPDEPSRVEARVLLLRPKGPAVDAGVALPNINDDFLGSAPDLGAHELGGPQPVYGPRKNPG